MVSYKIETVDDMGVHQKKTIELASEAQLQQYLDIMNTSVIKVDPLPSYYKYLDISRYFSKVSTAQVVEILENMHVVVHSGLSMNTALLDLAKDADSPKIANLLTDISYNIQMSSSISAAMQKHEKIFTDTVIGLVKIGEETGELETTLKDAAAYLKRIDSLRNKLKSAIIVPVFTLVMMMGAFGFWMVVVMPSLISVFESFNIELPTITKMIIATYDFLKANIIQVAIGTVIFLITFVVMRKKILAFRVLTDKWTLKLPVIGITLNYYNFAFVAEYTRLMVGAGLPLYQALGILGESLKNTIFKHGILRSRELISSGKSFSGALADLSLFSALVVRMIAVGEQTGSLEDQLEYISKYYYDKVDYISDNIAALIQPLLTVVLGAFLIIIMAGFLGPISDMVTNIGK